MWFKWVLLSILLFLGALGAGYGVATFYSGGVVSDEIADVHDVESVTQENQPDWDKINEMKRHVSDTIYFEPELASMGGYEQAVQHVRIGPVELLSIDKISESVYVIEAAFANEEVSKSIQFQIRGRFNSIVEGEDNLYEADDVETLFSIGQEIRLWASYLPTESEIDRSIVEEWVEKKPAESVDDPLYAAATEKIYYGEFGSKKSSKEEVEKLLENEEIVLADDLMLVWRVDEFEQ